MTEAPPFPRRLAFQGQVEASAFGFSRALFADAVLRERVFSLWQSGARLEEFEWGHVLWLARPFRVRAGQAPALPLVSMAGGFFSAYREGKGAPDKGVWIVENGEWHELRGGATVDVSRWLDVSAWALGEARSLGEVAVLERVLAPVELDLRAQSGIGAPDQKWQMIWERGSREPRFGLRGLFERLARLLTPRREAGDVPFVSNARIVWSSLLVLGGAGLFCLGAFVAPPRVPGVRLEVVALALVVAALAVWLGAKLPLPRTAPRPRMARATAPPIVLPATVQMVAAGLIGLALVRVALRNFDGLLKTLAVLSVLWAITRALGLVGRLVGSRAVGVAAAPAAPLQAERRTGWFARWLEARAAQAGSADAGWIARWLRARASRAASGAASGLSGAPNVKTRDNTRDALRRLLAQLAMRSGLFKTLGRAQARALLRSMELFERGDLEAALRHAVPLGAKSEGDWSPPPALSVPGMRGDLSISPFQSAARGSLNFGPDIEAKLRALYRRAFETLRDAGDFDKAAFVLAELLNDSEEAVAFLEEHGRLELAAQIAEARTLAPGLVVRQWWIAGKRERAGQLARLRNAFADAIVRLERDPERRTDAAALRLLWGHQLARSGRFGAAVEAVWPVEEGRPFALRWLRLGLEENPFDARLLCRALELEPRSWDEWQPRLHDLWASQSEDAPAARARFARELIKSQAQGDAKAQGNAQAQGNAKAQGEAKAVLEVAARATLRAHIGDAAAGRERLDKSEWERLLTLAGDAILRADARLPTALNTRQPEVPAEIRLQGNQGTLAPRDAVRLESGELLVALGEAGAQLRARDGRVKAHFDVPAHQIVRPFEGSEFLLLAPRDESTRVSKLDLRTRQTSVWGDLRLDCFAPEFDGALWFVAGQGRVRALDVSAKAPVSLWDSGDLNGEAQLMAIAPGSLAVLVSRLRTREGDFSFESWRFELPSLVLRQRLGPQAFPRASLTSSRRQLFPDGEQFALNIAPMPASPPAKDGNTHLFWQRDDQEKLIESDALRLSGAHASPGGAMVCWQNADGCVATLVDRSIEVRARLHFPGAHKVAARECDGSWLAWDDLGRVALFNPQTGRLEREWTLS